MKKIKVFLLAFITSGIALTSCSKDDDSENTIPPGPVTNGEIMAKWNPIKTVVKVNDGADTTIDYDDNEAGCPKDYIQFAANNVLNRAVYVTNVNDDCEESVATDPATWTKTNNTLAISGDAYYQGTYEIQTLSNTELIVKKVDVTGSITTYTTVYFTKATN